MIYFKPKSLLHSIRIKRLYKRAFPKEERKPFSVIEDMQKRGKSDIWYFEEDGAFLGMATSIIGKDKVLIDYFAVLEKQRSKGNGERMLRALIDHYSPKGVFLEIEIPYEDSANYLDRQRRKRFYLRTGLVEMGTSAKLFGVDMELLSTGFCMSFDEYRDFYLSNCGAYAYNNIKPIDDRQK